MKKAELFNLYVTLQSSHPSVSAPNPSAQTSKARRAPIAPPGPAPTPRHRRPSASLGRVPDPVAEGRQPFPGQLPSAPPTVVPHAPDLCNSTFTHDPRMFVFPSTSFSFPPSQAPGAHPNVRMPPLAGQSPAHFLPLPLPHYALPIPPPSIPGADLCARMPPQAATAPTFPPFNPLQVRSPFSLFSATPQPAPPNAVAAEPPPVTNNIRAQILAGADVDLGSLLSLFPPSESNRQSYETFFNHMQTPPFRTLRWLTRSKAGLRPPSEALVVPSRSNCSESLPVLVVAGRPRSRRQVGSPFGGPRGVYSRAPAPSKRRSSPPDRVQRAPSVQPAEAYPSDAVSIQVPVGRCESPPG
ncbi:hypothetical protein PO909_002594 [Leuciscus waleckii]